MLGKTWLRTSAALAYLENGAAGVLIIFAAVMICVQVTTRTLFDYSFTWAEEAVRYAIIWLVFVGSAIAVRENAHISIEVLQNVLPARLVRVLRILVSGCGILTSLLLLWYSGQLVAMMARLGQTSPALQVPMYWFYLAIPVSAALMGVRFTEQLGHLVATSQRVGAPAHGVVG